MKYVISFHYPEVVSVCTFAEHSTSEIV